ncbi:MAG: TonB-dependent receptor [Flavisolibacter sp.]|jgi:hemoglobin/transferrin/lactoferrin receptor protein|nr:TonB-dependent receptor [Flavisolibacter sp.]
MRIFIPVFISFFCSTIISAQDSIPQKNLEEVIIYSNKFAERKKNLAQKIDVIAQRQINLLNSQNTGDLLVNTGNVFVQKSQQGGSSPIIRGFEASRVLLVVDGIRMNNAIYRSGHLQNVITVDQNMLERIEVLYGPASTLYGSDALGGVVHMRTKQPNLSATDKLSVNGSAFARYSSANKEKTMHADVSLGGKKLAWLQSYNLSDFDDLKMGSNYHEMYPDFGRRSSYITTVNGIDSIVTNDDDRIQKFSGYKQWDVTQKLLYQQNQNVSHLLNVQFSNSSDVPRYDRLQDIRNGNLRFAEWYYGPQKRELAAYELTINETNIFTNIRSIISYQHIQESRHQREYRQYTRHDNRFEDLSVWGATLDARKLWTKHELTVGADAQLNDVKSTAFRKNIFTGETFALDTRYPNGKNKMNYFGIYAQHIYKMNEGKIVFNDGIRLQTVSLHSAIKDNTIFNLPFSEIKQNNTAVTGNFGLIFMPQKNLRMHASLSSGFRAPNVDDAAKIFESNTASRQVIVPNAQLKPEYTYNIDLGITSSLASIIKVEATGFYTLFKNAIALAPAQFKNADSILYNGIMVKVFSSQNINKAFIYGFSSNLTIDPFKNLRFFSTISYTCGRLKPGAGGEVPLDHIPPLFGKTSIEYDNKKMHADFYILYNGWKRLRDYNPSGEDNAQYATPDGTPSWMTLNFKTSLYFNAGFTLQTGIENLLDRNYRHFASGFSAAGRNFILALRVNFKKEN